VVEVGGTKIVAGIATETEILDTMRIRTDVGSGADAVTSAIADALREVQRRLALENREVAGVGASVPGPVDTSLGVVSFAPNLEWVNYPVAARLSAALDGVPVIIDQDGNCGGLGEAAFGAGVGYSHQVYVTIGTGIGGAVIVDGLVDRGFRDAAGEVGHMTILPGGPHCRCGNNGCLEALASGPAIARRGRQLLIQQQAPFLQALTSGDSTQVTAQLVIAAAADGDAQCQLVLDDVVMYLGIGLANVAQLLNPQAIILGGGVMQQGEGLRERIDQRMRSHLFPVQREGLLLKLALLGDRSGLWGALQLVKRRVTGSADVVAIPALDTVR
jgi:glucokinase